MAQLKKREYSKLELVFGNLAVMAWILLGAASFWLYTPAASIVFFASASFMVFYELGKKGCANCFQCKTCTIGMGKLPYLFYTKTSPADLNINRKALKLFPYVFLLLSVVPIAFVVVSISRGFSFYGVALLLVLVGFSVFTGLLRRKILTNPWL